MTSSAIRLGLSMSPMTRLLLHCTFIAHGPCRFSRLPFVKSILATTLFVFADANPVFADRDVSKDEAVRALKQLAEPYRNIKWTAFTQVGTSKPPYSAAEFIVDPQLGYVRSFVVFDFRSGHYRFDNETVAPVAAPKPPPSEPIPKLPKLAGARMAFSFNGKQQREFTSNTMTTDIPDASAPGNGSILIHTKKTYNRELLATGLAFFPMSLWGVPLHEVISTSTSPVTITDTQRGQWLIKLTDKNGHLATVTCDLEKGGVISAIDTYFAPDRPLRFYRMQLERLANGLWVPKSTWMYILPPNAPRCHYTEYSNVAVNVDLNPNIFAIHFPPRTSVADEVRNQVFTVGEGPEGDFTAVKSFIEQEGFNYEFGPPPDVRGPNKYRKWLIAGVIAGIVIPVLFWLYRTRRRRLRQSPTVLVIAVLLGLFQSSRAQSPGTKTRPQILSNHSVALTLPRSV